MRTTTDTNYFNSYPLSFNDFIYVGYTWELTEIKQYIDVAKL